MTIVSPILQFGTSRFLQAHVDLFVSEALERGEAIGTILVVQTTASAASAARIAAMAGGGGYPVRIRGLRDGKSIDEFTQVQSIRRGLQADRDWPEIRSSFVEDAMVIVSNTGEQGYELDPRDQADCLARFETPPHSFPAKLAVLLHARWQARPDAPLSLFPCELITRNGDRLRSLVAGLAADWNLDARFVTYLHAECRWANSLVDRIVSEPILPVGAIGEPYALWAIEQQDGLVLPCRHDAIVLTDDLARYERLKLHLLNLGHTILAETWQRSGQFPDMIVVDAMKMPSLRDVLELVWTEEVLPVFDADGMGEQARAYLDEVRERFLNPFLAHRLSDIAQNHQEKKRRRLAPVIAAAERQGLPIAQARLRAALEDRPG